MEELERIKQLFDKANIKYIISVDDCHNSTCVNDEEIRNAFLENLEKAKSFCIDNDIDIQDVIDFDGNEDVVVDLLNNVFDNSIKNDDSIKAKSVVEFCVADTSIKEFCEKLKTESIIDDYKTYDTTKNAQDEFDSIQTTWNISESNKILWFIDNDFTRTGGSQNDGAILIKNLLDKDLNYNNVFALVATDINSSEANKFRQDLHESDAKNLMACVLTKNVIRDASFADFYKEILAELRNNYSGKLVNVIGDEFSKSSEEAINQIRQFKDKTINQVFFVGSIFDGVSPLETFQRILIAIIKDDIDKRLSSEYDNIYKLICDYCELCELDDPITNDEEEFTKIKQIREIEYYNNNVNELYLPVSNGDIFQINDKYYILVSQSCNLAVRGTGQRTANCATLLRVIDDPQNSGDKISSEQIDYFIDGKTYQILFNDSINVDFSVLDLCVLNSNGNIELLDDFNFDDCKFRYTKGMVLLLERTIAENRKIIDDYRYLSDNLKNIDIDDVIEKTRNIYKDNTIELKPDFERGISFNARRMKRLNSNSTESICLKYFEYQSRKALDFDFTNHYKMYTYKLEYDFPFDKIGLSKEEMPQKYAFCTDEVFLTKSEMTKNLIVDFLQKHKIQINKDCIKDDVITIPKEKIDACFNDEHIFHFEFENDDMYIKINRKALSDLLVIKPSSQDDITVTNKYVRFCLKNDLVYENASILKKKIRLVFNINKTIKMQIEQID